MADKTTSTEITTLVSSMADRKRQDLDFLRAFLMRESAGEKEQASSWKWTNHLLKEKEENKQRPRTSRSDDSKASWNLLRCLAVDLPLVVLFASLALVYVMRCLFTDYYVPIMARARRTDQDLLDEYTYYERQCTAEDITHGFAISTANTTTEEAMDSLLMHGACIIPDLISPGTVANLRRYLQHRNNVIAEDEKYPMSQGYRRLSYGLEPTEDEAIVQAIEEITSNRILPALLKETLGMEDPALSEITTITSFFGAEDQVIHSDTKSDGYAAQFARTYSHSYSLFIPVQPITTEMGVTQLCPGTHYCTNDMQDVCEEEMLGINTFYGEKEIWPAGHGALINQQVWHGGSRHNDPQGPERILFILSFIARPQLGKDTRQLARGTYFHMRWSMWGHCWFDILKDSAQSTKWPFNMLRALAVWKPRRRHWGYDLLLSAALRATNRQNGMEAEDLETFIDLKMNNLFHFPKWLQGGLLSYNDEGEESIWQVYIQETLDNTLLFLQLANAVAGVLYFIILAMTGSGGGKAQFVRLRSAFGRLAVINFIVASLAWITLERVRYSDWGTKIASGLTFMRPFPLDSDFTSARWEDDPTIPQGISTLPERNDVLFGTRYDAPWLGSYNRWLDYHPGNIQFETAIAKQAQFYPIVRAAGHPVLLENLVRYVMDEVAEATQGGRYLAQDHFSGDWVALERPDAEEMVRTSLAAASNPMLKEIDKSLKYLVADHRFGSLRGTALAYESSLYLFRLRKLVLRSTQPLHQISPDNSLRPRPPNPNRRTPFLSSCPKSRLRRLEPTVPRLPAKAHRVLSRRTISSQSNEGPKVGTPCMVYHSLERTWAKGTVVFLSGDGFFDIEYANGRIEENVSIRRLRRAVHVQEGTHVRVRLDDAVMHGVLALVSNGRADIVLEDGELISDVIADAYDIQWPMF